MKCQRGDQGEAERQRWPRATAELAAELAAATRTRPRHTSCSTQERVRERSAEHTQNTRAPRIGGGVGSITATTTLNPSACLSPSPPSSSMAAAVSIKCEMCHFRAASLSLASHIEIIAPRGDDPGGTRHFLMELIGPLTLLPPPPPHALYVLSALNVGNWANIEKQLPPQPEKSTESTEQGARAGTGSQAKYPFRVQMTERERERELFSTRIRR